MTYRQIGNVIAQWDDDAPLRFNITGQVGSKDNRHSKTIPIDLSDLCPAYTHELLCHFKDLLLERTKQVALTTIETQAENIHAILKAVGDHALFTEPVAVIDESYLLALGTIKDTVGKVRLRILAATFNFNPHSPIFSDGLATSDFPTHRDKKGAYGNMTESILVKALSRAACIEILARCEALYEDGEMDIGHFSFINLAFHVFCRPESYRQITVSDIKVDPSTKAMTLFIVPAKSGVNAPRKIPYPISSHLAPLLLKQRQHVIATYGHLVSNEEIGKLALFPARALIADKQQWKAMHANMHFGALDRRLFAQCYPIPIKKKIDIARSIGANALRHTVGTQLARAGCSAKTIQAVLKHASDQVANAYVDLALRGLIDELSDAMQPAFERHLPAFQRFRSTADPVALDKAIRSEDIESGRIELTGECGKQIKCEQAPFTCYGCNKFIPAWDADHSINLNIVQKDIERYKDGGTPWRHMVDKFRNTKASIILVMSACEHYKQANGSGAQP